MGSPHFQIRGLNPHPLDDAFVFLLGVGAGEVSNPAARLHDLGGVGHDATLAIPVVVDDVGMKAGTHLFALRNQ